MKKLLSGVELSNLLQINWNQQKIQNNFKIIVDALSDHDKDKKQVREDIESLKQQITFIKTYIKEGGATNITNHNVNVTKQEKKGDDTDPFKIRQMMQRLQKQIKELGNKQSDTDILLDQIRDVQERLKEDIKVNNTETQKEAKPSKQNIRINSGSSRKVLQKQKRVQNNKVESSLKDITNSKQSNSNTNPKESTANSNSHSNSNINSKQDGNNQVLNQNIQQALKSNKAITDQLAGLLQKIDELKSDNILINARLNSQQKALQTAQKAPAQSKLRSSITKPTIEIPKIQIEKTVPTVPTVPSAVDNGNSQKNLRMQGQIQDVKDDLATLQDQINKYYLDANTLRLCYEEMKLWVNDLKKADSKKDGAINEINNRINQIIENQKDDKNRIDNDLKDIRAALLKSALEQKKQVKPQTPSVISSSDRKAMQQFDENYKDKINDKLSKLQALLMQAATQSDLERVRIELKQNIQDSNNKIDGLKQSIGDINKKFEENELDQQSQNSEIRKIESDVAGLSSLMNDKFGAVEKKNNITNSKIEETKKNLQQIKQDLEFYKESFNKPSVNIEGTTGSGEGNGLAQFQGRNSVDFDRKKYDELRKELLNKLHDTKAQFHSQLKDFERKFSNKNTFEQDIAILFDKIGEIKLFLGKKADAEDTKKSILYLQKKMSVAFASLSSEEDGTEDARAAKKNWFCLSCDKVLQNYNGKVGKHIVWDGLGTTKFGTKTGGLDQNKRPKELQPLKK